MNCREHERRARFKPTGADAKALADWAYSKAWLELKDFNPREPRDPHTGEWTGGGGLRVAKVTAATPYPSMMTPDEQEKTFGFHISTGGDAVPGGYNGYLVAKHPDTGEKMGHIEYNSASAYREAETADIQTEKKFRGRGVATNLLQALRAELNDYEIHHGMTTDEGTRWRAHLPPELKKPVIPALKPR